MIKQIVIAGPGLMGASIAQHIAQFPYQIMLYARRAASFDRAKQIISECQQTLVKNHVLTANQSHSVQDSIVYTTELDCFQQADLVIESIPEVYEVKTAFLQQIAGLLPPQAIVATNTSAISVDQLAGCLPQPDRFCGMHWLNPPHIIPLVEVIKGEQTSQTVIDTIVTLLRSIRKEPVVLKKDIKGFISNRLQFALLREASYLVATGVAEPEDIDRTLKYGNGIRYSCSGPFKIVDLGGVEVFQKVARYLYPDLCNEDRDNGLLNQLVAEQHVGIASGKGFYSYDRQQAREEIQDRDQKLLDILKLYGMVGSTTVEKLG